MNRPAAFGLVACAALGLAACGPDSRTPVDPAAGTVTSERELAPPDTKTILIDGSHDGGVWWFPQAGPFDQDAPHQGKAFADELRALGYRVDEVGRASIITSGRLGAYPVVIRAGKFGSYTDAEMAAYLAFAASGHPVVLLSEFLRDGQHDELADSLGIPLAGLVNETVTTFASHTLTKGMTPFPYIAGSVLASVHSSDIRPLGWLRNGAVAMGTLERASTKIFFIGDINGLELQPQPFVKNLIAWAFPNE